MTGLFVCLFVVFLSLFCLPIVCYNNDTYKMSHPFLYYPVDWQSEQNCHSPCRPNTRRRSEPTCVTTT
jgi:hypothetical protein